MDVKNPADVRRVSLGCCDVPLHSSVAKFVQTICATFGDGVALQTIRAIGGDGVALQTIRAIGGDSVALQTIRAIGGDSVALQTIRAISGDSVALQTIRTISGDSVALQTIRAISGDSVALQTIRAISSDSVALQTIRTIRRNSVLVQTIGAVGGDHCVGRGSGESVNCENRESDAEKSLAFHDGVLRGVIGWYGADVTPGIFYENFIAVIVNIDADDVCQKPQSRALQHLHCAPDRLNRPGRFADRRAVGAL
jgi:hypothetical protein